MVNLSYDFRWDSNDQKFCLTPDFYKIYELGNVWKLLEKAMNSIKSDLAELFEQQWSPAELEAMR